MLSHDDPRLTRYALGEMNDEERIAFERELTDADRAEIDSIRTLAGTLASELKAEPIVAPAPMKIAAARRSPRTRWILAAAASVAAVGLVGSMMLPSLNRARETAFRPVSAGLAEQSSFGGGAASNEASGKDRKSVVYGDGYVAFQQPAADARKVIQRRGADSESRTRSAENVSGGRTLGREQMVGATAEPETVRAASVADPSVVANVNVAAATDAGRVDRLAAKAKADERAKLALDGKRYARGANDELTRDRDGIAKPGLVPASTAEAATADSYATIRENPFIVPQGNAAVSTFGIDVDTASYANVRRFLTNNALPPADAVRIEELVNYFPTSDAPPTDGKPFAVYADVARCPWTPSHQLVRVALKAKEVDVTKRPPSNLVFLVDVSGSMNEPTKLPLVKRGLLKLVDQLGENDRVAIVVYAGNSGLALPSTNAANKDAIRAAIDKLEAGGSTNGGQGIELAYGVAQAQFLQGGANRVILCTDGDFNVGVTDRNQLNALITEKAKAGVFLNVLGFGRGNLKDDTMESLADKGNGQYAYIDNDREAQKVLVEQASGTLLTVAKDVKIQIEFNPAAVRSYRLIGYENRLLAKEDFNNDLKDAGEIGAGHNVVALYEIDPTSSPLPATNPEGLKYQPTPVATPPAPAANVAEILTLKLRYKAPDAPLEQGTSELIERTLMTSDRTIDQASPDFQFAAAVAGFGMMLRGSPNRGDVSWSTLAALAKSGLGIDVGGHRAEFLTLIDRAASLSK